MASLLARLRTLWRGVFQSSQLDAEMDDEMRFHVEMQAERIARERGLDPAEATRQAFIEFGGVEKWKEAGRDTRGTQWIDSILMDSRLGLRMLVKHRSLTIIGAFSMTVAIAIGAIAFEVISEALNSALPFTNGDRVVSIEYATELASVPEKPDLHDFADWRSGLASIQQLGAFRSAQQNLATADSFPEPVLVAEITASAFTIAQTPPELGRYLLPDDERDGAARVMVIGHAEWQRRFGGDPSIIGKAITLNTVPYTIVGVMPQGFAFPVNHQYWVALEANPSRFERREGPLLTVFGVLPPDVTREAAEAQLSTMHRRLAEQDSKTFGRLRPIVLPYTLETLDIDRPVFVWALRVVQLLISALLVIVAINLAILFYARTVTRLGEIAVRSALGASRRRILAQLFLEAFLLSVLSAATGLLLADRVLLWLQGAVKSMGVPFWMTFDLSWNAIAYAIVLAVVAALIVGVIPGLKTTGVRLDVNLRALTGGTGLRVGAIWTTLIVAQVAAASAILPVAMYLVSEVVRMDASGAGFPADRFVIAKVDRGRQADVMQRVAAEPGVSGVTFSSFIPGYAGDRALEFEDEATNAREGQEEVTTMAVDVGMFDVYDAHIVSGRPFGKADLGTTSVIVNQFFEREFFPDGNVLGQRFSFVWRQASDSGTELKTFEIVGVVSDFPAFQFSPGVTGTSTIYLPAAPDELESAILSIRFAGAVPPNVAGRMRQIGAEVDAAVPVRDVNVLADFYSRNRALWRLISSALAMLTLSVVLLSAAGIYALMSFTVAQRTREIGIRSALGGDQRRILAGVFGRVMIQIGIGLALGSLFAAVILSSARLDLTTGITLLLAVGAVIVVVGVTAAIGPARRSLRMPAIEALRAD